MTDISIIVAIFSHYRLCLFFERFSFLLYWVIPGILDLKFLLKSQVIIEIKTKRTMCTFHLLYWQQFKSCYS